MPKSIKKGITEQICVKRRVTLGQIPKTEKWLNEMANQGYVLVRIEGTKFFFCPKKEVVSYFMLSPEKGANSSSWIYYEFLKNGGIRIPHNGTSHMSPNLVLKISDDKYNKNKELYGYYFQHRNYRLFHRMVSNALISMIFFLLCVIVIFIDPNFLMSLFYICLGSLLVGIHNALEICRLTKSCKVQALSAMWKRPKRPGY